MGHPVFCHLLLYTESCRALLCWTAGGGLSPRAHSAFANDPRHLPLRWRGPHDPASRNMQIGEPAPLIAAGSAWRHPETWSSWISWLAASIVQTNAVAFGDRLPGNWGVSQIRNVQRSSRSGFTCQCGASETDSTEVRIPSPARSNDLGRMNRTSAGGTNFTQGATGVVWLTGASISLKAVSGRSAMGMTETKVTAAARRSRNANLLRFNTRAPK
jgi:hypothetical protein